MISPLSIDKPIFDHQKHKPFSPTEITSKQNFLQRKLQQQQQSNITIQPKNVQLNNNYQNGLSKLLKTSPYGQLIKQKSQNQIFNQDSISQNYLSGCSPPFQTSHNFFHSDLKQSNQYTQNNNIQRRIPSNYKVTLHKKSFDNSSQLISCRVKDQQTISTLQQLLQRTNHILQNYKDEINKYEVENAKLKEKIAILKNS